MMRRFDFQPVISCQFICDKLN